MRAKLSITLGALVSMVWAVPLAGAAQFISRSVARESHSAAVLPLPARFRVQKESGLLLRVWLNGSGPYIFALDTGAGLNVITERVAGEARLPFRTVRPTVMGGLTSAKISSNREVVISQMSVGDRGNSLPSPQTAVIVSSLAPGIDGILDPTEAYSAARFARRLHVTYESVGDPRREVVQSQRILGLPVTQFYDGSGKRTAVHVGEIKADQLRAEIEKLL